MKLSVRYYLVVLMAAVTLSYWPSLNAGFVTDDWVHTLRARSIGMAQELNPFFAGHVEDFRPTFRLLIKAMDKLFGTAPLPFHLMNLFAQFVCILLAFRVGKRFLGDKAGLVVAALFALHPGPSEAVIWPAAISNPLSTIFALGAMDFFTGNNRRARWLTLPLAALAYLTHESTAPLVAVFVIIAWCEGRLKEYKPLLGAHVALSLFFVLLWFMGPLGHNQPVAAGGWKVGPHGFFHIVEYILSLTIYPGLYLFPLGEGWLGFLRDPLWLHVLFDMIFAGGIGVFLVVVTRRERSWLVAAMLLLVPVSFFTWGNSSRYLHLPLFFWSMSVTSVGWRVFEKSSRRRAVLAALAALLVFYGANDFKRSMDHRRKAVEVEEALKPIFKSLNESDGRVVIENCVMHPDHIAAAVRVKLNDMQFEVVCENIKPDPYSPPRAQ